MPLLSEELFPPKPEQPQEDWSFGGLAKAMFEQENSLGVLVGGAPGYMKNWRQPGYNPWEEIKGTPYEEYFDEFAHARNPEYTIGLKREIDRRRDNRKLIDAAPWQAAIPMALGIGLFDPVNLLPVAGVVKKTEGGYSLLKSAGLMGGLFGGAAAGQELLLRSNDPTRTDPESAMNIGFGVLAGALFGTAGAALLSRAEMKSTQKAADDFISLGGTPLAEVPAPTFESAGAAAVDRITREAMTPVGGKVFQSVSNFLTKISPAGRVQQSPNPFAREMGQKLEGPNLINQIHSEGESVAPGGSVGDLIRLEYRSRTMKAAEEFTKIFAEGKKAGLDLSADQFADEVGRVMRRGDVSQNPFVEKMAQVYRSEIIEPFAKEAQELGLLPADLKPTAAVSYFSRLYNETLVSKKQDVFLDRAQAVMRRLLVSSYDDALAKLEARQKRLDEEISILKMPTDELKTKIAANEQYLDELQRANPIDNALLDRIEEIKEQRKDAIKSADRATAQRLAEELKNLRGRLGKSNPEFLAEKKQQTKEKRLLNRSFGGVQDAVEKQVDKWVDTIEQQTRAMQRVVDKGRKLERTLHKLSDEERAPKLASLRDSVSNAYYTHKKMAEKIEKELGEYEVKAAQIDRSAEGALEKIKKLQSEAASLERTLGPLKKQLEARAARLKAVEERLDDFENFDLDEATQAVRTVVDEFVAAQTDQALARGARLARIEERIKKFEGLTEGEIKKREAAKAALEKKFRVWQDLKDEPKGFEDHAREIASSLWQKVAGVNHGNGTELPDFIHRIDVSGPLKNKTAWIRDEVLDAPVDDTGKGFLIDDARQVMAHYARKMAGQSNIVRMFDDDVGMTRTFEKLENTYEEMREKVRKATTPEEIAEVVGKKMDKEKAFDYLAKMQEQDTTDLGAMRDQHLNRYKVRDNMSFWGQTLRAARQFNYVRLGMGFALSSLSELYRPAMVHGLSPYMKEGLGALVTNLEGFRAAKSELKNAGIAETIGHSLQATRAELGDPYAVGTPFGRAMNKFVNFTAQYNPLTYLTEFQQSLSGVLTMNKMLRSVEDGTNAEWLASMGINKSYAGRIAEQFKKFGKDQDGVLVANTERWTDVRARKAFQQAVAKDVERTIVARAPSDLPLAMSGPIGATLLQFRSFNIASMQKVLLRGLQEDKTRFIQGLVAMTTLGIAVSYLKALYGGEERLNKWLTAAKNPGFLIGEGLDQSGVFALMFDVANTGEGIARATGHPTNVLKDPLTAAFGGTGQGQAARFRPGDGVLQTLGGPTAGLIVDATKAAGLALGDENKAQKKAATRLLPWYQAPGIKQVLQVLTDDSPFMR